MAEEHGFESSPEGHRLCVNNCGFLGSPATQNMCSKCYRDLKHGGGSSTVVVEPTRQTTPSSTSSLASSKPRDDEVYSLALSDRARAVKVQQQTAPTTTTSTVGRCSTCRKRIGLTGFRCRCGTTFCGVHRYPERHGCSFDYKALGREAIAKENPLVKAEKLNYKI